MEKKIPMRMCIACRQMKPKKDLIRIVKTENGIVLDSSGRLNGRGAYICPDGECIKKLKKSRLINKAFSCEVPESVYDKIEEDFFGKEK